VWEISFAFQRCLTRRETCGTVRNAIETKVVLGPSGVGWKRGKGPGYEYSWACVRSHGVEGDEWISPGSEKRGLRCVHSGTIR